MNQFLTAALTALVGPSDAAVLDKVAPEVFDAIVASHRLYTSARGEERAMAYFTLELGAHP